MGQIIKYTFFAVKEGNAFHENIALMKVDETC